jgi:hypothetical protein
MRRVWHVEAVLMSCPNVDIWVPVLATVAFVLGVAAVGLATILIRSGSWR